MFEQTFPDARVETRKPAAVAASLVFQSIAMGGLLLIPLLHPELLPVTRPEQPAIWMIHHTAPEPPAPEVAVRRRVRQVWAGSLLAPTRIPEHVTLLADEEETIGSIPLPAASSANSLNLVVPLEPPPPPAPVPLPEPTGTNPQLSISKGVQAAKLIFGPKPDYPRLAITTRVQGVVRMQAIIGAAGYVRNLQVLSGPPLLVKAAVDAVSQWRYQPTLLTGVPVEVATEIDVNFTLNQ